MAGRSCTDHNELRGWVSNVLRKLSRQGPRLIALAIIVFSTGPKDLNKRGKTASGFEITPHAQVGVKNAFLRYGSTAT